MNTPSDGGPPYDKILNITTPAAIIQASTVDSNKNMRAIISSAPAPHSKGHAHGLCISSDGVGYSVSL